MATSRKNQKAIGPTTAATVALTRAGIPFTPHAYHHDESSTDFGAEAASALGIDGGRVFKTLMVDTDKGLAIAIVSVDSKLDVKALARAVGAKRAVMADAAVAERKSGYVVGGISPFGQKTRLPTVLDDRALAYETIYVSGGRRGFDIEVTPADVVAALGAQVAVIRRT
ncbi:Cys-tRNA(Pro) deacylase [Subtercola frigoramans]|uniref:Cys-tRNA(Pro)/Cys-tRNA(Cys) deacylase n=1 Tax=Subtercola frigoramans TaxID=120298 RepID=A0ABS2L2F7_9MICO|nr:Cys-tRNA(Pro) deacylase [Subtercola frigoramans]MBM7471270.1 Cys-tRNA(Pro)/Cys-tRNA(Cys) deacylase [Subtercola frigoramans]